jgi:hypothetical protein
LDAFIKETLQCDTPVVNIMVVTRHDMVVLGHQILQTRASSGALNPQPAVSPYCSADHYHTSKMNKPAVVREN